MTSVVGLTTPHNHPLSRIGLRNSTLAPAPSAFPFLYFSLLSEYTRQLRQLSPVAADLIHPWHIRC